MTAILGLNAFHPDSSACLLIDGKLVGAVAEERLGARNKHTMAFPVNSIKWLLDFAGITLADITHVAIARKASANVGAKVKYTLSDFSTGKQAVKNFFNKQKTFSHSLSNLPEILGVDPSGVDYKIHNVEHHIAHIASSYYCSPFEELTAGWSYDGSGDFASAMAARCEGTKIEVLDRVTLPSSLGHFYTAMCQFIGFDLFGEEYKVMGLAPYGEDKHADQLKKIVRTEGSKWFNIDHSYLSVHKGLSEAQLGDEEKMRLGTIYSDKLVKELGAPRIRGEKITQREMDIARSTQVMFERAASNCFESLQKLVPMDRLAMAGGCALNGVMNARIYRDFPVNEMYLQCASSDDGTAIGAAYDCWHNELGKTERFHMRHGFWGPGYSEERISKAIKGSKFKGFTCDSEEKLIKQTSKLIADGAVVGWYQGRSEWGPRALGNRSILANPAIADMKCIINQKIKKREGFRPFAPSVLKEEIPRFFEQDISSPFMMHVVKFKKEWREKFPAVTHVDGTGRMQSVDKDDNPLYHKLISAVKDHTGYGIVLNTSFNENEPVVDTPEQAISCFARTDMDYLVMGRQILAKDEAGFGEAFIG